MNSLNLAEVATYVNENIVDFHQRKITTLEQLRLSKLLKKNPYLFKAKNVTTAVKSSARWGNSSQQKKLEQDLRNAVIRVKQARRGINVEPVLGICYGKTRTSYLRGYMKVVGQNFWYLISEDKNLYTNIVEPIGYRAREHNEVFALERGRAVNLLTKQFIEQFCITTGAIDWVKLIEFNCKNYDLDKFLP